MRHKVRVRQSVDNRVKMKKYQFWKFFVVALFGLVCVDLFFLSREVIYKGVKPSDKYNASLKIDVCYRTWIAEDHCHPLKKPDTKIPKERFTCDLKDRLSCYTKGLKEKNVTEILSLFENCSISDWTQVEANGAQKPEQNFLFYSDFVCVRNKFEVIEKNQKSNFSISSALKPPQPFDVYVTYTRDYENDGRYKTKKTHLFERVCWLEYNQDEDENANQNEDQNEDSNEPVDYKCTETDKEIFFLTKLYSTKHLEHPFTTDCVHRTDSTDSNRSILQYDCYEECVKKDQKYYLLTYYESDDFPLKYGKTQDFAKLLDKCADLCNQEDCQATSVYVKDIYEEKRPNSTLNGRMILELEYHDYRAEAIPLLGTAKVIWMVVAFVSIFFGVNVYKLIAKPANRYGSHHLTAVGNKGKKKKWLKTTAFATILGLALGLALEGILFDFGRDNNLTFVREDSITERSVSVGVCFSICAIVKDQYKDKFKFEMQPDSCPEEELAKNWTIGQLDEFTWNASDFKQKASARNNARPYPIKQDDFPIPHFFRDLKKCFLIYYEAKNYWPHFSMQKYSRIYINITGVRFEHFFVEDGHNYPGLSANSTKKSFLHSIWMFGSKPRHGCVDYQRVFGSSKDELVRLCVIAESAKDRYIPASVTLRADDEQTIKYSSLKFRSDRNLLEKSSDICKAKFEKSECHQIMTEMTYQDMFQERDSITVDLTPYIYEIKPFEDENGLIVTNRILSFLLIFAGFSVREFSSALIFCFFNRYPIDYSQLKRRLFLLFISLLFLLNFCFLFHSIIHHPMLDYAYTRFVNEFESSTRLRFCFETKIDLSSDNYTLKDLNSKTLNFSKIFESVLIYNDDNKLVALMTEADFKPFPIQKGFFKRYGTLWNGGKNNQTAFSFGLYIDRLKCHTLWITSDPKSHRNLNVHYHRLQRLYTLNYSFNKTKTKENNVNQFFIFLTQAFTCNFEWDKTFGFGDYLIDFTVMKKHFQDDYFHLKNLYSLLRSLVGQKTIDTPADYLEDLRDSFIREQYATTNFMAMSPNDEKDLPIKNRQFNYYMQFRAIATKRNEYDFTKNTELAIFTKTVYTMKSINKTDRIKLNIETNPIKFEQNSRNRYRYVECFLHLFVLAAFWFRLDLWTLPTSLANAYPFCKYFTIYALYYLVSLLVYLFDLWFAFVRFLKFKND